MSKHKTTESEEMYLISILIMGAGDSSVCLPITDLAAKLRVRPVSANQMVRKMAKEGLVEYFPYKGVKLTESGKAQAERVLRLRRLWEVFLVRDLGMSLDDADAFACDLEHIPAADVADRLAAFLGYPQVSYHGDPIGHEGLKLFEGMPLSDLQIGESAQVVRIHADELTIDFLSNEGIKPGVNVRVLAIGGREDILVQSHDRRVLLSAEVASVIRVGRIESAQSLM